MTDHSPTPNTNAAIEFLQAFAPEGPWCLTAINPDRKGIETVTFSPTNVEACRSWIDKYNGRWNLYFSVNPVNGQLQKKAAKSDIARVEWLHVDIDPRAGEDLAEERERMLRLLTDKRPEGIPAPTLVIDSGGGHWGFWKLREAIQINGDIPAAENAESYNRQLELQFGADACHNIDRIARLPGTVNIPDAGKLKKGRQPALASVVSHQPDLAYGLECFTPAPTIQRNVSEAPAGRVVIPAGARKLVKIDELDEWKVDDRLKIICAQGHHPDEPKAGDNSRSIWLFDAACGLVRASVPDEII